MCNYQELQEIIMQIHVSNLPIKSIHKKICVNTLTIHVASIYIILYKDTHNTYVVNVY